MQCYCCFKELEREHEPSKAVCIECLQEKLDYKQDQIDALRKELDILKGLFLTFLNAQKQSTEVLMRSLEDLKTCP